MSIRLRSRVVRLSVCVALLAVSGAAFGDDDPLAAYRDRFLLGMEKYKGGAVAEAIRVWAGIYEEIGPKRGYRLSFNLARAYDRNGEATRAAERYRSFLDQVAARRNANETIDVRVEDEERVAEERLGALDREHGRIEIASGLEAMLQQVDDSDPRLGAFTAYVAPGKHVVTFGPGQPDAEKVEITVAAGELVLARPTRIPKPVPLPPLDPILMRKVRPFSPVILYVSGVATAASVLVPALEYGHAWTLYETATGSATTAAKSAAAADYPAAKTSAYALLAVPIGLGAVTGGLLTWYFFGTEQKPVTLTFDGTSASVSGSF